MELYDCGFSDGVAFEQAQSLHTTMKICPMTFFVVDISQDCLGYTRKELLKKNAFSFVGKTSAMKGLCYIIHAITTRKVSHYTLELKPKKGEPELWQSHILFRGGLIHIETIRAMPLDEVVT